MNRYEEAAARLQKESGVRVEWAPANREYVVEGTACPNIREARKKLALWGQLVKSDGHNGRNK